MKGRDSAAPVICPRCRQQRQDSGAFCAHCGFKLEVESAGADDLADLWNKPRCPRCGRVDPPNPAPGGFCRSCAPSNGEPGTSPVIPAPVTEDESVLKQPPGPTDFGVVEMLEKHLHGHPAKAGHADTGATSEPPSGVLGRLECPLCHTDQARREGTRFCVRCGVCLEQSCPHCNQKIPTASGAALTCPRCAGRLRSCRECLRLYPPETLACVNPYCPCHGQVWTTDGRGEVWAHPGGDGSRSWCAGVRDPRGLVGLWRWLNPGANLLPPVNALGMVFCAESSGYLRWFLEEGGEPPQTPAPGWPREPVVVHQVEFPSSIESLAISGEGLCLGLAGNRLVYLDIRTRQSRTVTVPETPIHFLATPENVVAAGAGQVWLVDGDRIHGLLGLPGRCLAPVTVGNSVVAGWSRPGSFEARVLRDGAWRPFCTIGEPVDRMLGGDSLWCFAGPTLYEVDPGGRVADGAALRAPLSVAPGRCRVNGRLVLCHTDGRIGSCAPDGQRWVTLVPQAGRLSAAPLLPGRKVLYGAGESLHLDGSASPLLNGRVAHLSAANGKVFGVTENGGLYAFLLEY
ncbi:MAG: hypothetical protein AB1758_22505 [Candidatus Eremiobacterota bacterium]